MRAYRPDNRRRSGVWIVLGIVAAVLVGGVGTVGALGLTNVIDLEKLAFWRTPQGFPEDWVAVPVCAKTIPAYSRVEREYLMKSARVGDWLVRHLPPKQAEELERKGTIMDINRILSRVTARDKPANYYFTEADFLPPGSSPGVAGGTPLGKRAVTLDASKLDATGLHDLKVGDHVDLLASVPVDMPGAGRSGVNRMGTVVASPDAALVAKRDAVPALVQDGVVISPVRIRQKPLASRNGVVVRTEPVEEIVIAVDPKEVAGLAEAVDLKYRITCVLRSGRPTEIVLPPPPVARKNPPASSTARTDPPAENVRTASRTTASADAPPTPAAPKRDANDATPGFDPMSKVRLMEVMVGSHRQYVVFSGPNSTPIATPQENAPAKADAQPQATGGGSKD